MYILQKNEKISSFTDMPVSLERKYGEEKIIKKVIPVKQNEKNHIYTILNAVPFSSQAPSAQWSDPIYQDGCEEAVMIMAMAWVSGRSSLSKEFVEREIKKLTDFEIQQKNFGLDVSSEGVVDMLREYFHIKSANIVYDVQAEDIVNAIYDQNIVIVPVDGTKLKNPHFTLLGPEKHMILIVGYDPEKKEFITHDPGTRSGKEYRYPEQILFQSIRNYPSGYHLPNLGVKKVMIVVGKV